MSFYTSLRDATVGPLIKKYGMAVTLRQIIKGAYNPDTGTMAADTTADYTCYAIAGSYNAYMVANSLVRQDDQKLVVSAQGLTVEPKIGDRFVLPDGSVWNIPTEQGSLISQFQPIKKIAPAGVVVMYEIQVRK
jgi:hypothetical protein